MINNDYNINYVYNIYNDNYKNCKINSLVNVIFLNNNSCVYFKFMIFQLSNDVKKNHMLTRQVEKKCQTIYNNKIKIV